MSHTRKIFRNSVSSLANKLVTIALSFISRKLFLMFLTEELLGLNSLFSDLLGLLNLADMGLAIAVQFNLFKPIAEKDYDKIGRILNATSRIYNLIGTGIILAGIGLSFFIQYFIKENPYELSFLRVVFIINVVSNAATYFFVHKRIFMQACEDLHISYTVDTVVNLVCSVLRIVTIAVFKNYYAFVLVTALQAVISNVVLAIACDKRHPYLQKIKGFTKEEMQPLLGSIKELLPNKISAYIFSCTDNTILSLFIGLSSITMYTNYNSIVLQFFTMAAMFSGIIKVSLGNVIQERKNKEDHILFLKAYQLFQFFYSSFCTVALFCLLDDFVALWYGEKFLVGLAVVVILTLDFYLHSMYQPLSAMLEVLGEFKALKWQEIAAMILNIVVSVGLVVPFGIAGPVLGTLAVDLLTTIFRLHTILYKNYREWFKDYLRTYIMYALVFLAQYVALYAAFALVPLERSLWLFLAKGVTCFVVVIGSNLLLFHRKPEFVYLKDRALQLLKRKG